MKGAKQHVRPVLRDGKSEKHLWSRQLAAAGVFCSGVVFLQKDAIADVSLVFLLPHSYPHKSVCRYAKKSTAKVLS